jgi:WD40 repeat protein
LTDAWREHVPAFRLKPIDAESTGHHGEVFACAFAPDGRYVVSGGWDAHLRVWDVGTGSEWAGFQVGRKPVSACVVSPDGTRLLSGCLEGFLSQWDAAQHHPISSFLAHPRPISCIAFAPDASRFATASWDRTIVLRNRSDEREGQALHGHDDIVSGCLFTPDGKSLISWSHDGNVYLWNLAQLQKPHRLTSHDDRVTSAAISPDGHYAAFGSRAGHLKLCDLRLHKEISSSTAGAEIRACFFLLHGKSLVVVNQHGELLCLSVPDLESQHQLRTETGVQCAALSPAGNCIALGCDDGRVRLIVVEGFDSSPLVVNVARLTRRSATRIQRIFGRSTLEQVYRCTCPVCRNDMELSCASPGDTSVCSGCRRPLMVGSLLSAS